MTPFLQAIIGGLITALGITGANVVVNQPNTLTVNNPVTVIVNRVKPTATPTPSNGVWITVTDTPNPNPTPAAPATKP